MEVMRIQPALRGCLFLFLCVIAVPGPAGAFMTYRLLGGAIHREIIEEALKPLGVSKDSISVIVSGADSQDNPLSVNYSISEHHFTENKIKGSYAYVSSEFARALEEAGSAHIDALSARASLFHAGLALHALQDFYSHANYVELLLAEKKALQLPDWDSLSPRVRTCYFWFGSRLDQEPFHSRRQNIRRLERRFPGVKFHSDSQWRQRQHLCDEESALAYALSDVDFLHLELNKDNDRQTEGKVVSREYGKTFFELARRLAVEDTARHWSRFERQVTDRYGEKASLILPALKGTPVPSLNPAIELPCAPKKNEPSAYMKSGEAGNLRE